MRGSGTGHASSSSSAVSAATAIVEPGGGGLGSVSQGGSGNRSMSLTSELGAGSASIGSQKPPVLLIDEQQLDVDAQLEEKARTRCKANSISSCLISPNNQRTLRFARQLAAAAALTAESRQPIAQLATTTELTTSAAGCLLCELKHRQQHKSSSKEQAAKENTATTTTARNQVILSPKQAKRQSLEVAKDYLKPGDWQRNSSSNLSSSGFSSSSKLPRRRHSWICR